MKNKILIFIAILLVMNTAPLLAQSDYEEWLKKDQQQFDDYKTEQDRLFMQFLEDDWKQFQVFQGLKVDDTPKPTAIPKAEPQPLEQTEIERNDTIKELDVPETHKSFKSPGKKKFKNKEQIVIDNRQIKIVESIKRYGKITNRETRDLLKISNKTAYNWLKFLVKHNVIKKVGRGRSIFYVLR